MVTRKGRSGLVPPGSALVPGRSEASSSPPDVPFAFRPPEAEGGVPVSSAISVQPEVSDALLVALKSASIVDEHRALMGAVIEKIQSAESGLNEACISLIKGFEVCFMRFRRVSWYG